MHAFMLIKSAKYANKLIKYYHNIFSKLIKINTVNLNARNFENL